MLKIIAESTKLIPRDPLSIVLDKPPVCRFKWKSVKWVFQFKWHVIVNFLPRSKLWRWRKTFWAIFLMLCCATLANTAFLDKIFIQHSRIFSWHFSDQVSGDIYLSSLRPRAPALLSEMSDIKSWTSTWGHALICAEFIKRIQSSHLLAEWGHVLVVHVQSNEVTNDFLNRTRVRRPFYLDVK